MKNPWELAEGLTEGPPMLRKKNGEMSPLDPLKPASGKPTQADAPGPHPKLERMRKELEQVCEWAAKQLDGADFLGREELQKKLRGLSKLPTEQVAPTLKAVADKIHASGKWFAPEDRKSINAALDGLASAFKSAHALTGSNKSDTGLYNKNVRYIPGGEGPEGLVKPGQQGSGRWKREPDTKSESAWAVVESLLREGIKNELQTRLSEFEQKMEEARKLKDQLYISLEKSVTGNPRFAQDNDAWKHLHDFQEAGLEIESAINEYKKIVNDFEKFSRDRNEEVEVEEETQAAAKPQSAFHR